MKKIATIAFLLPIIALTSCGKEKQNLKTSLENNDTSLEDKNTKNINKLDIDQTKETLNQDIISTTIDTETIDTEKTFEFSYEIGGNMVPVKGKFILKDGKVKDMIIDGADLNGQTPIDIFAKNASKQVIGKELKGLKIDSISGASYVTVGFNKFLSTLE